MNRSVVAVIALLAPAIAARAQVANTPTFEVASIKVNALGYGDSRSSPDRYARAAVSLRDLITEAYNLQTYEVVGGPDWLAGSVLFDVAAKSSVVPSPEELRLMLQRLLADRFALRAHHETRDIPVYVLRLARKDERLGSQLNKTSVDCDIVRAERIQKGDAAPRLPSRPDDRPVCTSFLTARQSSSGVTLRYQASGITGGELAAWLSRYVGRPVLNRSALMGELDLDLAFSRSTTPADGAVSIYTALEEQLGLRLEADRGPVEVLVIDSAQLPTSD